jgi:hypothetical protein
MSAAAANTLISFFIFITPFTVVFNLFSTNQANKSPVRHRATA